MALMTPADRAYVRRFLAVELQPAIAAGKPGYTDPALARIDTLRTRCRCSDHPLTLGLLHEARAQTAWEAMRSEEYEHSMRAVERWFGSADTPALVAKLERLRALSRPVRRKLAWRPRTSTLRRCRL